MLPRRLGLSLGIAVFLWAGPAWAQPEKIASCVEKLGSKKKPTRLESLKELGRHGTAAKDAVEAVGQLFFMAAEADEVAQAAATLAQIGPESVPVLTKAFKDARAQHAQEAAKALARMGPAAKKAVPALIDALRDPDPVVRHWSALALGEIGDFSEEVTFALFGRVADPVINVRWMAGKALVRAGPKATPGLRTILKEGASLARVEAAGLLGMMGTDGSESVVDLMSCLEDDLPQLRGASALALGRIGTSAKEVMPSLLRGLVAEKNVTIQEIILKSVMSLGNKDVPGFLDELRKINHEHGWAGPVVLARFGARGPEAVKPLIKLLHDIDQSMRLSAILALGQLGPDAAEAVPQIHLLLKDPNPMVRAAAAQSVVRMDSRFLEVASKQFALEVAQAQRNLEVLEPLLAKPFLSTPSNPVWQKAFADAKLQANATQIVQFRLLTTSSMARGSRIRGGALDAEKASAQMIENLRPVGIPALVDGILQAEAMRLGLC